MKECKWLVVVAFVSCLLTACTGSQDITTEKTTEQPKDPVIVLGDENLLENVENLDKTQPEEEEPVTEPYGDVSVESPTISENTTAQFSIEGPVLVIGAAPKNAVLETTETDSKGGYLEALLCEDGKVHLSIERIYDVLAGKDIQEIQEYYAEKGNWQQITLSEKDETLSESLGYPVYRFRYTTGEGEESMMHNSAFIAYDAYGFFLDASSEASDYPDMEALTDVWIETVSIFDEQ